MSPDELLVRAGVSRPSALYQLDVVFQWAALHCSVAYLVARTGDGSTHPSAGPSRLRRMKETIERMAEEIRKVVIGQDSVVELLLAAVGVSGHVLIEGVPGVAKTLLANALSRTMAVEFHRVQFTPDMEPQDLTGSMFMGQLGLTFRPGPVFTNLLLADEINRTPPRTQAALLEVMQERQVTMDGRTHPLPDPFVVIATQNPHDQQGTFPLPEAVLDRFLFKIKMDYPSMEDEVEMLHLAHRGLQPATLDDVQPVLIGADLLQSRYMVDRTYVPDEVSEYVASIVRATREMPTVALGASPRAAVHLLVASKASAALRGRDTVTPDDVARMALPVLRHRIVLRADAVFEAYDEDDAVRFAVSSVPVPAAA